MVFFAPRVVESWRTLIEEFFPFKMTLCYFGMLVSVLNSRVSSKSTSLCFRILTVRHLLEDVHLVEAVDVLHGLVDLFVQLSRLVQRGSKKNLTKILVEAKTFSLW